MLRNRRQHVDAHRLCMRLARKLQGFAVINLMQFGLVGFDGFLEVSRRVVGLVG